MSAVFSPCGRYRLRLDRVLDMLGGVTIGWCPHNPSKADAEREDPSSRRMVDFTRRWGGSRMVLVNPWAGRATKPKDLWSMDNPIGPENDRHIAEAAAECAASGGFMVAAWGAISPPRVMLAAARLRLNRVQAIIAETGCELRAIGVTSDGSPRHPLYVRADALPMPWPAASAQKEPHHD